MADELYGTVTVTVQVSVTALQTGEELDVGLTGAAGEDGTQEVLFLAGGGGGGALQVGLDGELSVTGQTVVETGMTEVTTTVLWAGQLVTVSAQLVIV